MASVDWRVVSHGGSVVRTIMSINAGVGVLVVWLRVFVACWWRARGDIFWFGKVDMWFFVGRFLAF